jgi:hypothetical protein
MAGVQRCGEGRSRGRETGSDERGVDVIAEGKYKARAIEGDFGVSSKKGSPFVRVRFELETADGQEELAWDGYFSDTAGSDGRTVADRTIESLRYCGCTFPGDEITNLEGLSANQVSVDVQYEPWENAETGRSGLRPKIAWVNGIGYGTKVRDEDRMEGRAKVDFARKMKGALLASKPKGAPRPAAKAEPARGKVAPKQVPPATLLGDEDIPF